ncbi:MAG: hypothetical protein HYW06_10945 [Gemmatimonadetes bacterium]|nr:hypothetical protein [Gemmatimonadota bacterium]
MLRREDLASLILIPLDYALPAVQAHLARWPYDDDPPSREELRKLIELAYGYVSVSQALIEYAKELMGTPGRS